MTANLLLAMVTAGVGGNNTNSSSYPDSIGFIASGIAVVFFGSNYVPVKKVDAHDGFAFQFFLSTGIWLVGLCVHLIRRCPQLHPLAMLGGFLWSTGNLCVVPIIQTIGLSLGLLLWGSVSMLSGWASGRFGWFDVPAKQPTNSTLNYAGVGVSLLASVFVFFVSPTVEVDIDVEASRSRRRVSERRQPWRQFSDQCNSVSVYEENISGGVNRSLNGEGDDDGREKVETGEVGEADGYDDDEPLLPTATAGGEDRPTWQRLSPAKQKATGILLCLVIGPMFGLGFVPTFYVQSHTEAASQVGLDYVFAHFTGIMSASTLYFFLYCVIKRNRPVVNAASALPAAVSGVAWGVACAAWFLANEILSTAVTFPIVTTAPAVLAAFWGVCVFREIRGVRNLSLLAAALAATGAGSALTGLSIA